MKIFKVRVILLVVFIVLAREKGFSQQRRDSLVVIGTRERSAEYPGGQAAMYKFINTNLQYPKNGSCVEGNVYIKFCIEADGSITNIKVAKGFYKECDEEAVRVISMMPKWSPALEYGTKKPIKSYFTVPCKFRLE